MCAPFPPGYLTARGAGVILGCRVAYHDRGSRPVGQRGGGTITAGEPGWCRVLGSRSAFPGREFQSHLTVPLRRLNELTPLHSTLCVGECAAAPGS